VNEAAIHFLKSPYRSGPKFMKRYTELPSVSSRKFDVQGVGVENSMFIGS
jgi:hypothetical protein